MPCAGFMFDLASTIGLYGFGVFVAGWTCPGKRHALRGGSLGRSTHGGLVQIELPLVWRVYGFIAHQ